MALAGRATARGPRRWPSRRSCAPSTSCASPTATATARSPCLAAGKALQAMLRMCLATAARSCGRCRRGWATRSSRRMYEVAAAPAACASSSSPRSPTSASRPTGTLGRRDRRRAARRGRSAVREYHPLVARRRRAAVLAGRARLRPARRRRRPRCGDVASRRARASPGATDARCASARTSTTSCSASSLGSLAPDRATSSPPPTRRSPRCSSTRADGRHPGAAGLDAPPTTSQLGWDARWAWSPARYVKPLDTLLRHDATCSRARRWPRRARCAIDRLLLRDDAGARATTPSRRRRARPRRRPGSICASAASCCGRAPSDDERVRLRLAARRPDGRVGEERVRVPVLARQHLRQRALRAHAARLDRAPPAPERGRAANLALAGDWTRNGICGGSVEAAVTSGLLAAQHLSGSPAVVPGTEGWLERD